jgi:hypothetical protein
MDLMIPRMFCSYYSHVMFWHVEVDFLVYVANWSIGMSMTDMIHRFAQILSIGLWLAISYPIYLYWHVNDPQWSCGMTYMIPLLLQMTCIRLNLIAHVQDDDDLYWLLLLIVDNQIFLISFSLIADEQDFSNATFQKNLDAPKLVWLIFTPKIDSLWHVFLK